MLLRAFGHKDEIILRTWNIIWLFLKWILFWKIQNITFNPRNIIWRHLKRRSFPINIFFLITTKFDRLNYLKIIKCFYYYANLISHFYCYRLTEPINMENSCWKESRKIQLWFRKSFEFSWSSFSMVELNQICRDVLTLTCLSGTRAGAELGKKFCKF